jgi:ELWxxDGT repeat protein
VGSDVLIGAYLDDTGAANSGAVYRFSVAADLAPLAGLQSLEVLSLAGQGVEDIRALNGLVNLDYLYLHDNAISDIDGLLGLSIRDNTDAGYVETGTGWTGGDNAAAYGDTYRLHPGGNADATASWAFDGLAAGGTYELFVTWTAHDSRNPAAQYRIYDGANLVATVTANQRITPTDKILGGSAWASLGSFRSLQGALRVELSATGAGNVVADAAHVARLNATIADNADASFETTAGTWATVAGAGSVGGTHRVSTGAGSAGWTFDGLEPGVRYEVFATWQATPGRATDAVYTLYDGFNIDRETGINQRQMPTGRTLAGANWASLGVVEMDTETLRVMLSGGANGSLAADAVTLVRADRGEVLALADQLQVLTLNANPLDNDAHQVVVPLLAAQIQDEPSTLLPEGFFRDPNPNAPVLSPIAAQSMLADSTINVAIGVVDTTPAYTGAADTTINLTDGAGFLWDITSSGAIQNGTSDAFDLGLRLAGNLTFPFSGLQRLTEDGGREIVIGTAVFGDVQIIRKIYVPADQSYARFLEVVTNNGSASLTQRVPVFTDLGSDGGTVVVGTSSGDQLFSTADRWIVTDDVENAGDPVVTHVIAGAGAAVAPADVSVSTAGGTLSYAYDLNLAPGETQVLMHFAAQNTARSTATAQAPLLEGLPSHALRGMSTAEIQAVVNFNTQGLYNATPPQGVDADGHPVVYSAVSNQDSVRVRVVGDSVLVQALGNFTGTARITLTAQDGPSQPGDSRGRTDVVSFDVHVGVGGLYGTKFQDLDGDGVQDAGEAGIEGWTVYLDQNRNGLLDTGERSTVTDVDGHYGFGNLALQQSYTVAEARAPGWVQTAPAPVATEVFLAADINPGGSGSFISSGVNFNGALYFQAYAPTTGYELWRFDGHQTELVADIESGGNSSAPQGMTAFGGSLYFSASTAASGSQLWRYDGTQVQQVTNFDTPSVGGSGLQPALLTEFNGALYFRGASLEHGYELWRFDGTTAARVSDIVPGSGSSVPTDLAVLGDKLYFGAYFDDAYDWRTAGDYALGGAALGATPSQGSLQAAATTGADALPQSNLEADLGLSAGALDTVVTSTDPDLATSGSAIYREISVQAGQTLSFDWTFQTLERAESALFNDTAFVAIQATGGSAPVVTPVQRLADTHTTGFESVSGTVPVRVAVLGLPTGNNSTGYQAIVQQLNDDSWFDFSATLVTAEELDTAAELAAFDVIVLGDSGAGSGEGALFNAIAPNLAAWVQAGGGLVMTGWGVYGTASASAETRDVLNSVLPVVVPSQGFAHQGTVAPNTTAHPVTDGVSAFTLGNNNYIEFPNGGAQSGAQILATTNGAASVAVREVASGKSVYLGPIYSGSSVTYSNAQLRAGDPDRLLEQAVAWAAQPKPAAGRLPTQSFTHTFASAGTYRVAVGVLDVGDGTGDSSVAIDNVRLSGQLIGGFENGLDEVDAGYELWRFDGTVVEQAAAINPGTGSSGPTGLTQFGDALYFRASSPDTGAELWRFDGTSASRVSDIRAGLGSSNPGEFEVFNNALYFQAFTTGQLSWQTLGGAAVSASFDGVAPSEGAGALVLASAPPSVAVASIESGLGIVPGSLVSGSFAAQEGQSASTTVTVSAGDTLTFQWTFLTQELQGTSYDDFGFVSIQAERPGCCHGGEARQRRQCVADDQNRGHLHPRHHHANLHPHLCCRRQLQHRLRRCRRARHRG